MILGNICWVLSSLSIQTVSAMSHSSSVQVKRLTEKGTRVTIAILNMLKIFLVSLLQSKCIDNYIQPTEGFMLSINGKEVGSHFALLLPNSTSVTMLHLGNSPEAYEKLFSM